MSEPIWNQYLTERDKQVFAACVYGARQGFGKRPALLVIDVSWAFAGDRPDEPILEPVKRWRNSCGAESWDSIGHIKSLIDKAHEKNLPVIHTTTTSGCVRATVIDAFSLNYRVTIAEEGCFDRSQAGHAINLCDMNARHADVLKTAEVLTFFDTLADGLFELPKGNAGREPRLKLAASA